MKNVSSEPWFRFKDVIEKDIQQVSNLNSNQTGMPGNTPTKI